MLEKLCPKCGKTKSIKDFSKSSQTKDGLDYQCRKCKKISIAEYRRKNPTKQKEYYKRRKKEIARYREGKEKTLEKKCSKCKIIKPFFMFRKLRMSKDGLSSRCKKCLKVYDDQYHKLNLEKEREYYIKNRDLILKKYKKSRLKKASYFTYCDRLTVEEEPIEDSDGFMLCRCANCKEYFYPEVVRIQSRIWSLKNQNLGECRLYCSDKCKEECDVFNSKIVPRSARGMVKKARCSQSTNKKSLLQLQLDDYGHNFCEKCGKEFDPSDLALHHNLMVSKFIYESDNISHQLLLCQGCHTHEEC